MSDDFDVVPLSPMRNVIASRMTQAKQSIPHYRLCADVEVDALLRMRQDLSGLRPDARLSLNDLLIKACGTALIDVPALNVQWAGNEIHQYHTVDISVIIALPGGGLSTPIIRSVESKSVWEIGGEVRELARRAARNALKMAEIAGGSFSISNLGMYGVDRFDAIINPPQSAILAVGCAKERTVAEHGQMRIAKVMSLTLSVDHRAVDGATAALFLAALRRRLEQPEYMRAA